MNEYVLMTYYIKYLKNIRKVSDSTVKHYQEALRYISKYLVEKEKIEQSVYEIQDVGELEVIKAYLYNDLDFVALDKRGHQMYSAGFNNYFKFASGQGFSNIHQKIGEMDIEVPVAQKKKSSIESWQRSTIIKIQSIESVGYQCEIDPEHHTFTAKSSGHPYMEGHHALPMKLQEKFDRSLDIYANIVCLCPICHRLLHYGVDAEKQNVVDHIYYDRAERLASSGIKISRSDFERLVI
jgi:5-methylcytosine-specific restriction protein A